MQPFIVAKNLPESYAEKWHRQFVATNRSSAESIWRRTQEKSTADKSGWQSRHDRRRRMVHYHDTYNLQMNSKGLYNLVIQNVYLWFCVTLPGNELEHFINSVRAALSDGNWKAQDINSFTKDGLVFTYQEFQRHPQDIRDRRKFPASYKTLELSLKSKDATIYKGADDAPWNILRTGIRKQDRRTQNPRMIKDFRQLKKYLPFQVEVGGGASIEMGIPPLNHLHQIYKITNSSDGSFIFEDPSFICNLLQNPRDFYENKASVAYKSSILAQPNNFYQVLGQMYQNKYAVGEVITNNFDGITALVGLKDKYVRRFDDPQHFPEIDFHPEAKSLLVVGSHADRRQIQKQARRKGLKIIYVDPEMYVDYSGEAIAYPLESLKSTDLLIKKTATQFANEFHKTYLTN